MHNKRAVLILGPPRSGTSYISGLIEEIGFYFGEKKYHVDTVQFGYNPEFYELTELNRINDVLYRNIYDFNGDWGHFLNYQYKAIDQKILSGHRESMKHFLDSYLVSSCGAIALKDPRFCYTLPYWTVVLEDMGYDVRYILVSRSLVSAAMSNNKINHLDMGQGYRIVMWSYLNALRHLEELDYFNIYYDELIVGNKSQLHEMAKYLKFDGSIDEIYEKKTKKSLQHFESKKYLTSLQKEFDKKIKEKKLSPKDYDEFDNFMVSYGLDDLLKHHHLYKSYFLQVYFDYGNDFNENDSLKIHIAQTHEEQNFSIDIALLSDLRSLRIDPVNDSGILSIKALYALCDNKKSDLLPFVQSNAIFKNNKKFFFVGEDAQMYFGDEGMSIILRSEKIICTFEYLGFGKDALKIMIDNVLDIYTSSQIHIKNLNTEIENLNDKCDKLQATLDLIQNSRSWKIITSIKKYLFLKR